MNDTTGNRRIVRVMADGCPCWGGVITSRVNGELRQHGRTSQMVFTPARLIAHISAVMTLEPGDVILTGTPSGVGPLAAGDMVEVEVGGVGVLKNSVE